MKSFYLILRQGNFSIHVKKLRVHIHRLEMGSQNQFVSVQKGLEERVNRILSRLCYL